MIKQSEFLISGILICIILVSGGIFIYHNNNNIQDPNMINYLDKDIQIDTDKETDYFKEYNKTANHTMSHQTFKNVDEAFAKGMITHHQMAIDMSETILKYTDNSTIKNMAENIIDTQTKEIQQMESIIQTIK